MCPFGSKCPLGAPSPTPCTSSELCFAGTSTPMVCPSYIKDCSSESSLNERCSAGEFLASGTCTACQAGQTCSDLGGAVSVSTGYFSPAGVNYAYLCPAGFDCSSGNEAVAVPSGWYSTDGGTPTVCPVGSACPDPTSPLSNIDCALLDGFYQDETAQTSCKLCTAGHKCLGGLISSGP